MAFLGMSLAGASVAQPPPGLNPPSTAMPAPGATATPTTPDGLPARPTDYNFVSDHGGLIQPEDLNRIGAAQKKAFEKHGVPIVVLTIPSMRAYQFSGTIEQFATRMFNNWKIGTQGQQTQGANKGILLVVSVGDRKARIELGADWARNWDGHSDNIMQSQIIPEFRRGSYSKGIAAGVEALAGMAEKNPSSPPPAATLVERAQSSLTGPAASTPLTPASPIPRNIAIVMVGIGFLLIVASLFMPEGSKKPVFWLGLILILLPFLFFVILLVLAWFRGGGSRRGGGGSGWSGGGFSSSGGFSGGFSGGGGSTGSW